MWMFCGDGSCGGEDCVVVVEVDDVCCDLDVVEFGGDCGEFGFVMID